MVVLVILIIVTKIIRYSHGYLSKKVTPISKNSLKMMGKSASDDAQRSSDKFGKSGNALIFEVWATWDPGGPLGGFWGPVVIFC